MKNLVYIYLCCTILLICTDISSKDGVDAQTLGSTKSKIKSEIWYENDLGKDEIVLPGFEPLRSSGNNILLGGGRVYRWEDGLFPDTLWHKDRKVAGPMQLVIKKGEETTTLIAEKIKRKLVTETKIIIETESTYKNSLRIRTTTIVEYDGVAMVTLEILPIKNIEIDGLKLVTEVTKNNYTSILGFKAATIKKRVKEILLPDDYDGEFVNVVAFLDGEKSFWWFADNAEGWIWNGDTVTTISSTDNRILMEQNLIGSTYRITRPITIKFNYLLTPVKEFNEKKRIKWIARKITKVEAELSEYQIWWTSLFSHQNLPYVEYPPGIKEALPERDIEVYPGLEKNKKKLDEWKEIGIHRIPYFSAHVLSAMDPVLNKYKDLWRVEPKLEMRPFSDRPFTLKLAKPWLSHKSKGYTDYLIYRFNELIKEVGFEGLYFDQGGVIQSENPNYGLWIDSKGNKQPSTDILGMREFFKRLAVLFYRQGKKGAIFVHNSMVPVVPAYTFVMGMVQGEEYTQYLRDLNYSKSSNMDEVLAKFAPNQYGINILWLSELWRPKVKSGKPKNMPMSEWLRSERYRKAWRGYMGMALIHNSTLFTKAAIGRRKALAEIFREFGTTDSVFHGYWESEKLVKGGNIYGSYYKNNYKKKYLMILFNHGKFRNSIICEEIMEMLAFKKNCGNWSVMTMSDGEKTKISRGGVSIEPNDFLLIEIAPRVKTTEK